MCGLCGFATKKGTRLTKGQLNKRADVMESLLIANEVRGSHSTGVALIYENGGRNEEILKQAIAARDFVKEHEVKKALRKHPRVVLGHTRYATMGGISKETAHPFQEGSIVGTHNGVIYNHAEIVEIVGQEIRVDSQAVFKLLNKNRNRFNKTFKHVRGSCALAWVNMRDTDKTYLISHENPLSVARVPSINTLFWSSQLDHLEPVVKSRFGDDYQIFTLKHDKVYVIDKNLLINGHEVKFKEYNYSAYTGTSRYNPRYEDDRDWDRIYPNTDYEAAKEQITKNKSQLALTSGKDDVTVVASGAACDIVAPKKVTVEDLIGKDNRKYPPVSADSQDELESEIDDYNDNYASSQDREDKLSDRAYSNGCDICGAPIYSEGFYDDEDDTLICFECHQEDEWSGIGQLIEFVNGKGYVGGYKGL